MLLTVKKRLVLKTFGVVSFVLIRTGWRGFLLSDYFWKKKTKMSLELHIQ